MAVNANLRAQHLTTEKVLALYQRWLSTRNAVIKNQLRALGIEFIANEQLQ
jgi:hypothetical protein